MGFIGRSHLVSSARVQTIGAHDHVSVWVKGGLAGELIVSEGDGPFLASILMPEEHTVKMLANGDRRFTPGYGDDE